MSLGRSTIFSSRLANIVRSSVFPPRGHIDRSARSTSRRTSPGDSKHPLRRPCCRQIACRNCCSCSASTVISWTRCMCRVRRCTNANPINNVRKKRKPTRFTSNTMQLPSIIMVDPIALARRQLQSPPHLPTHHNHTTRRNQTARIIPTLSTPQRFGKTNFIPTFRLFSSLSVLAFNLAISRKRPPLPSFSWAIFHSESPSCTT